MSLNRGCVFSIMTSRQIMRTWQYHDFERGLEYIIMEDNVAPTGCP